MIYSLKGKIILKEDSFVIIEAAGVGYQVYPPSPLITEQLTLHTETQLFTYHHIREDNQQLFGFSSQEDRQVFTTLISLSGVGPKVALKILSSLSLPDLNQAIITEDITTLTQIPGVGKKMAERIARELKDKIITCSPHSGAPPINKLDQDLITALKTLGYSQDEVKSALKKASEQLSDNNGLEGNLKILLKHI